MKLISFAIAFCWFLLTVDALPLDLEEECATQPGNDDAKLGKRKVDYDPITKYSVQWFINNATPLKRPKPATCLFYTRGLSRTAYTYAKTKAQSPMTTIWDVWPGGLYNKKITKTNPLRRIMQDKKLQKQYYRNMSTAFASMCDVFATVMDANITPKDNTPDIVNKAGLWFKAEFPMLRQGYWRNRIHRIDAISPDGRTMFPYWTSPSVRAGSADQAGAYQDWDTDLQDDECDDEEEGSSEMLKKRATSKHCDLAPEWWEDEFVPDDMDLEDWELDN